MSQINFTNNEMSWFVQETVYMLGYERTGDKKASEAIKKKLNEFLDGKILNG